MVLAEPTTITTIKTLRPYQVDGVNHLKKRRRAFLTDKLGMGKSLQAAEAAELPTLIVCPKNLVQQWEDVLTEQFPSAKVSAAYGLRRNREAALRRVADWYIINYDMLRTYKLPVGMKTYIFDESHNLRNPTADRSQFAAVLVNKDPSARVYMLTATPMWKSVGDWYMQLHVLMPHIFRSYNDFVRTWCNTVEVPWGQKIVSIKRDMRGPLRDLLRPIVLGRTYKEVGQQLPPRVDNVLTLDMPLHLRKVYDDLKRNYKLRFETEDGKQQLLFSPVTALHALRQITAASGKYDAIAELVDNNDKQSIIGFWYRDHALAMYERMEKLERNSSVLLTGEIDGQERYRKAMKAQTDKKHIICTIESVREGMNLQGYRQVIMGEEHYPPGTNEQFVGRVVRGRNDGGVDMSPVLVYCVHVKNSIDTVVHGMAAGRYKSMLDMVEHILA